MKLNNLAKSEKQERLRAFNAKEKRAEPQPVASHPNPRRLKFKRKSQQNQAFQEVLKISYICHN